MVFECARHATQVSVCNPGGDGGPGGNCFVGGGPGARRAPSAAAVLVVHRHDCSSPSLLSILLWKQPHFS